MKILNNDNKLASLISFFLSKYDREALKYLGYSSFNQAYNELAKIINAKPNYIKLRRDEFDVFFPNSRQGWNKRDPIPSVLNLYSEFNAYSFDELGKKLKMLIDFCNTKQDQFQNEEKKELSKYSEKDIEDLLNFKDETASIKTINTTIKQRLLNYKIIPQLKEYYNYRCQICGQRHYDTYNVHIIEAHHIIPFVISIDNSISNLIILCPNHHRLVHAAKAEFDRNEKIFIYKNGHIDKLTINDHL